MKMKFLDKFLLAAALLFAGVFNGIAFATLPVDENWQGIGILYANTAGKSTIGIKPNRFLVMNSSAAASGQLPSATVRTYITGSQLAISPAGLQVGTVLQWQFDMAKTGAGSASSTIDICFGTAGTVSDTARVSFTKPGGVGNIDYGIVSVTCVIQSINATTGVAVGSLLLEDNQTGSGGHLAAGKYILALSTTSGSFDTTFATAQFAGLCITTGASDVITINYCQAQATGL